MAGSLELIFKEDVQKIFDYFQACFNIRILFYTPDGEISKVGLNQPNSNYCACIQAMCGIKQCLDLDECKRREAATKREMICYECHAGLMEAIKPVCYNDKLLGFIAIGQFRSNDQIPEQILQEWTAKHNNAKIEKAFRALPFIDSDRIDNTLGLFSILVDYIVAQHMIIVAGNPDLEALLDHMRNHLHEDFTMDDAARFLNKSRSTTSHLFTKHLGRSFKQTLVDMKLRKAEEYLTQNPCATVADAAAKCGYSDPLYFSRIYKKYRGIPPSDYRTLSSNTDTHSAQPNK